MSMIDKERPNMSSTCYRVRAQLLKQKENFISDSQTAEVIGNHEYKIDSVSIQESVDEDKKRIWLVKSTEYGLIAVLIGFLAINFFLN